MRKSRVATNVEVRALRVDLVEVWWRSKIKCLCICRMVARAGMQEVRFWIVIRARWTLGFDWCWRRVESVGVPR